MRKKIVSEKILEEIRASFPGKPVKTKSRSYDFTKEQIAWIGEHYCTTYCERAVSTALGIHHHVLLRIKAMSDPNKAIQYKAKLSKWSLKQREKKKMLRQMKAEQNAKSQQSEDENRKVWQWDIDEAMRLAAEKQK